ncbi:MAG TPA: 2-C-methyl-D-erythritol 4-phosphate cytidylyltransferase [Gemmatimonadaceae bacterium]|jgi:2-C-methyl-D-erythritol 4-phosphate cytidylyltransferase|nr:2-C-methyl-D-erythritol 4-phosphate cytidylyltransferase [Gemmatimonadaceae bacterium]
MTDRLNSSEVEVRDVGVVIVAGGSGTRAAAGGENRELKQFRWIAGKPALLHSLQTFMARPDVVSVVCVLPREYAADPPPWIFQCDIDRLMISTGGRTRTESVHNGLEDLPDEASVVLVHDAARPLVGDDTIDRVVRAVREGRSTIAALPVVDTLKEVDEHGAIVRTVERDGLWRAQTPQGFPREAIVRAHRYARQNRLAATDDAALCERLGIPVYVVRGSERAMKITEEPDFARAEAHFALPE